MMNYKIKSMNSDNVMPETELPVPDSWESAQSDITKIMNGESNDQGQGSETPAPNVSPQTQQNNNQNQQVTQEQVSKLTFEPINDLLALTDENTNSKQNCQNYKLSVFLMFKPIIQRKMFNHDQVIWLEYPKNITQIILEDNLSTIGFKGYIDIKNDGSQFDTFLNRYNLFYLVMNITEYNSQDEPIVKYEPYIFDISYVQNLSSPTEKTQILRIGLVDIITSILTQHSFASVIRFNSSITTSSNYKRVFHYIFEYVLDHIKTCFNYKYEYKKKLLFKSGENFIGKNITGHDGDLSTLVSDTFKKIHPNSSIKEALDIICQDSCTALKTPKEFDEIYDSIGDVLIPFFFKEELPDPLFIYTTCAQEKSKNTDVATLVGKVDKTLENFKNNSSEALENAAKNIMENMKEPVEYSQIYGGKAPMLLYRQMTMRDMYLPFFLAFAGDKYSGIYENINPIKNEEKLVCLNGSYRGNVYEMTYTPVSMNVMSRLWKNVIFLNCAESNTSGSSVLIFFSWFYDFFTGVFLNESLYNGTPKKMTPNVTPAFHAQMGAHLIPHYGASNDLGDNSNFAKIDEHNSYTYASKTGDTVNECLRVMGKNVASFVLVNDSYRFTINGNLRRRPNEIIKYWFNPVSDDGSTQNLTISTDIGMNEYTYMYVSQVIHKFIGNEYHNTIRAYKFVDVFQND